MDVFNNFMPKELINIIFEFAHNGHDTYIQDFNILIFCQKHCHISEFNNDNLPFYLFTLLCIQAKKHNNIHQFNNSISKYFHSTYPKYYNHGYYSYNTIYFYLQNFLSYK